MKQPEDKETIQAENKECVLKIRGILHGMGKSITLMEADLGFGNGSVGKWANGVRRPPIDRLQMIAAYLGKEVADIYPSMGEETKTPAPEEGSGRYGLTTAEWRVIGHQFRNALANNAKAPAYLSNEKTGLSEEEAEQFLDGKYQVSKDQITEMAALLGKPLNDLIGAYELAFDRPDNASPAVRLQELASQFPPEAAKAALRLYELSKLSPDSVSMYSAVLDQALQNLK